mmetsp:Transcript_28430/g.71332  ORF Transcript_28430/g.71332 Transcript_28430/m.71332 type:complete len:102 (+) Transcript_28430:197-502(+)
MQVAESAGLRSPCDAQPNRELLASFQLSTQTTLPRSWSILSFYSQDDAKINEMTSPFQKDTQSRQVQATSEANRSRPCCQRQLPSFDSEVVTASHEFAPSP